MSLPPLVPNTAPVVPGLLPTAPAAAPPVQQINMPTAMPQLGTPTPPSVIPAPAPLTQTDRDETRRNMLINTGSGIDQISNPFLRGLARTADIAGSLWGPTRLAEIAIPGTTLHHQFLVNQANANLANDQANAEKNAQLEQTEANTEYLKQRPAIEQSKIDQKQTAVQERVGQAAAAKGQTVTWDENGIPTFADDPNSQAFKDQTALSTLHQATADKDNINAEIAQNHYVPGTPEYAEAQRKLAQVDERLKIALAGLGLHRESLGLQDQRLHAQLYGTDVNGNELPGVLHDQTGTPVGTLNAGNVKPTTTARDAASRAEDLTAIQSRIQAALKDPDIQQYMGPVGGRLAEAEGRLGTLPAKVAQFQNDLVSYGAFQAGLHPVRGIGALEYFDKVMGGLHQTPEQLLGKLASNAATAGTVQQEGTMPTKAGQSRARSAPNTPSITGPKAGDVEGGYRFKGGNAGDPNNWEKVK